MCLKYIMRLIVYSGVDSGPVEGKKKKKKKKKKKTSIGPHYQIPQMWLKEGFESRGQYLFSYF